ncbi:MAG: cysteine--tRNA ligase [Nitrospirota bacterium]|nr:cysteine--tRNA ligase [Nitrospirota bacterium]
MPLTLYNTRTKKKEKFFPLIFNEVRMYVCGVTVYDDCHLGHARSALTFDVIRRYFEFSGYKVTYARNFTDIDDKILNRAQKEGVPWNDISERYIQAFYRDMGALGITKPDMEPRATEHIPDILSMVEGLVNKGLAYVVNGDVYFSVRKFPAYGQLSGKNLEELQAGARIEVDPRKQDPMDFALWKASKPGEPGWDSPWGKGRPGWHIECSAMSVAKLGPTFDIHGGGKDLIFPHHENEVAQSCGYTGKEFARYWVHNGFVTVDKEKMSKSLGNFFTIREIFEKSEYSESVTAECIRYLFLSTHYRSDLSFSDNAIGESKSALDNIYGLIQRLEESDSRENNLGDEDWERVSKEFAKKFQESMDDDFNTPKALAAFHEFRGEVNKVMVKGLSGDASKKARAVFAKFGKPLGLFHIPSKEWKFGIIRATVGRVSGASTVTGFSEKVTQTEEWIEEQIRLRKEAREKKDFLTADNIRKELAAKGIILEDRLDGTTRWKR